MFLFQCNTSDLCKQAVEAVAAEVAGLPIGAQVAIGLIDSAFCLFVGGGTAYLYKRCAVATPPTDPEAAPQAAAPPPAAGDAPAPAAGVADMAAQPAPEVAARLQALDEEEEDAGFFGRFWPM